VSGEFLTDSSGTAAFTTTIPAPSAPGTGTGSGLATVLVTLSDGVTTATARQVLTIQ
jgi:hypothetical protein